MRHFKVYWYNHFRLQTCAIHKVVYDTELMHHAKSYQAHLFLALMLLSRCFSLRARQYCDELIKQ